MPTEDPAPQAAGAAAAAEHSLAPMDLDVDGYPWQLDFGALVAGSPLFLSGSPAHLGGVVVSGFDSAEPFWRFEVEEKGGEGCGGLNGIGDNTDEKSKGAGKSTQGQMLTIDENSEESCLIKERMTQALRYFKDSTDQQVLLQVWAPIRNGNRIVLTTSGQPFVLDPQSTKLLHYRTVSLTYVFSADEDGDGNLGLPGRVFKRKLPEWTPNVQYYSDTEYQRLSHALQYNVQGTLALPVFDPLGQSCICVVELVLMSQRINYSHEVDKVCKALEAVNLKSSEILDHPNVQISNEGRQAALAEILEILTVVCETQNLPIAQTWIPCKHRTVLTHGGGLKKNCSSFDGSCMGQVCMSTTDVAFYVVDAHMWGFRDACVEHHLQKGQGVAGMAFSSRRPCFCRNIAKFCKSEYPLVHYAKMFGLSGCLAICLQSCHSGEDDYILEFFFPLDCTSPAQQQALLYSITSLIRQCLRNLKVSADINFQEGSSFELVHLALDDNGKILHKSSQSGEVHVHTSAETNSQELHYDSTNEEDPMTVSHGRNQGFKGDGSKNAEALLHSNSLGNVARKGPEKRRGKAEKTVSLEVLQQYFSGSLKDAAKSLGVCPTTMKRICRQHGISRWPSRKINKVNRSFSKLKCAIESVQGADGALNLTTLACHLPVTVDSVALPINADRSKDSKVIAEDKDLALYEGQGIKDRQANIHGPILDQVVTQPEADKGSPCLRSSSEESMNSPTSHGSCQGSPVNETFPDNQLALHDVDQRLNTGCSLDFTKERAYDVNHLYENLMIGADNFGTQPLGRNMVEDAGSSKDLKDLCTARVISQYEHAMIPTKGTLQQMTVEDTGTVTIKANYKENIIRFRLPCNAGVVTLHDEVAKRLKLELGTFDTKYLDDDHEWVMLACDADLEECIEISRSSGAQVIRLLVNDIMPNLGRSCESSGD